MARAISCVFHGDFESAFRCNKLVVILFPLLCYTWLRSATTQFSRHRRTLLANAIPRRSGVTARTGASPVPTIRRLGRPARRIVGVPLAGTLARFPLSFASKVRRRGEGERGGQPPPPPRGLDGPLEPPPP